MADHRIRRCPPETTPHAPPTRTGRCRGKPPDHRSLRTQPRATTGSWRGLRSGTSIPSAFLVPAYRTVTWVHADAADKLSVPLGGDRPVSHSRAAKELSVLILTHRYERSDREAGTGPLSRAWGRIGTDARRPCVVTTGAGRRSPD